MLESMRNLFRNDKDRIDRAFEFFVYSTNLNAEAVKDVATHIDEQWVRSITAAAFFSASCMMLEIQGWRKMRKISTRLSEMLSAMYSLSLGENADGAYPSFVELISDCTGFIYENDCEGSEKDRLDNIALCSAQWYFYKLYGIEEKDTEWIATRYAVFYRDLYRTLKMALR